jgi:glycerol-3-phosphate acyltransferase PlsX
VAAAQMRLRRLRGVHRPGIAIVTPTPKGPVALCDVGANVNCRPQHLHQYALMAGLYLSTAYEIDSPRVGLLNIGAEEAKGTDLVRQARELLSADSRVNFIGNVEGRDLFSGVCDVMVCEGFVGNVVLKIMEGMAEGIVRSLIAEMSQAMPSHAELLQGAALKLMAKYDYNEYGGAPLLGVDGICIICHGSSDYRGIMNAVRVAKVFARQRLNDQIIQALSEN